MPRGLPAALLLAAGCAAAPQAAPPGAPLAGAPLAGASAASLRTVRGWLARFERLEHRLESSDLAPAAAGRARWELIHQVRAEAWRDGRLVTACLDAIGRKAGTARARRHLLFVLAPGRQPGRAARDARVLEAAADRVCSDAPGPMRRAAAGCLACAVWGTSPTPRPLPPLGGRRLAALCAAMAREHDRLVEAWTCMFLDAFVEGDAAVAGSYRSWLSGTAVPDTLRAHAFHGLAQATERSPSRVPNAELHRLAAADPAPCVRAAARAQLVAAESLERLFAGPAPAAPRTDLGVQFVTLDPVRVRLTRGGAQAILPALDRSAVARSDPHLDDDLSAAEPRLRAWGAERLAESGRKDAVARLVRLASDDRETLVRVTAIDQLGASARLPDAPAAFQACSGLVAAGRTPTERLAAAQALWGLIVFAPDSGVLYERALAARDALLGAPKQVRQSTASWITANRREFEEVLPADSVTELVTRLRG